MNESEWKLVERLSIAAVIMILAALFIGQKWGREQGIVLGTQYGWEMHSKELALYCGAEPISALDSGNKSIPYFHINGYGDRWFKCQEVSK